MIARPISYGMEYKSKIEYGNQTFEGTLTFDTDGIMHNKNTNFNQGIKNRYYYKNGYVFSLTAETDEAYDVEVAYINENFEEAVALPFYASKINAFRFSPQEIDDHSVIYTCTPAIVFAAVGGVVELSLIALTCFSFILNKKAKRK